MSERWAGTAGRCAEEIADRDLLLHRTKEPAVIRRVRVAAHKCVFDDIITRINLAVSFTLIIVPNPSALPGEHGLDAQQVCHLLRLEYPASRVDSRDALTAELEPCRNRLPTRPWGFLQASLFAEASM